VMYRNPDDQLRHEAAEIYSKMVHNLHLYGEHFTEYQQRLSMDRIEAGTVVS